MINFRIFLGAVCILFVLGVTTALVIHTSFNGVIVTYDSDYKFWKDFDAWASKYANVNGDSIITSVELERFKDKFVEFTPFLRKENRDIFYSKDGKQVNVNDILPYMAAYDKKYDKKYEIGETQE